MFGGEVMAMMDKAAAIAGLRFCRQPLVTASADHEAQAEWALGEEIRRAIDARRRQTGDL